jgi:HK97 family phage prohead protease
MSDQPILCGYAALFGTWTEINSTFEGRFVEQVAPGAFAATLAAPNSRIACLYDHGHDPSIGNKPLAKLTRLEEDDHGLYFEGPLLDASYAQDLAPALRSGALGASFRFQVTGEDVNPNPGRSDHNPRGLPERTIREADLRELGPVTFPAYVGATAGLRSAPRPAARRAPTTHDDHLETEEIAFVDSYKDCVALRDLRNRRGDKPAMRRESWRLVSANVKTGGGYRL